MKLLLVGPLPPPYGGISVHIERLGALLLAAGQSVSAVDLAGGGAPGAPFEVVSMERTWQRLVLWRRPDLASLWRRRPEVVHVHTPGTFERQRADWVEWLWIGSLAIACRAVATRLVITVHGGGFPDAVARHPPALRALIGAVLRRAAAVIAVSERLGEAVAGCTGGARPPVVPAYLPPPPALLETPLRPEVSRLLERHAPAAVATLWFARSPDGSDPYGTDVLLDAVERLAGALPGLGVLAFVNGAADADLERACRRRVKDGPLAGRVHFLPAGADFIAALARADLFVRPGRVDGDALSVREALALGVPAIASDAALRPPGAVVVPTGDSAALAERMREAAKDAPSRRPRAADAAEAAEAIRPVLRAYGARA